MTEEVHVLSTSFFK